MKDFLKKIQEKPRSTRLLILWLASFFIMLIVVIIWLITFSKDFSSAEPEEKQSGELPSLFESIGKDFSTFRQGLRANIKTIYGE
jgi:hypothetical protein